MRIGYALLLAASFATPAIAEEIIIQGPQPGLARHAARGVVVERRHAWQDWRAARGENLEAWRDLRHGDVRGAVREKREALLDLKKVQRDHLIGRRDLNRARHDNDWKIQTEQ